MYWGLTAMDLMKQLDRMNKEEVLQFIQQCQHDCGGMGASMGHDPHLLYTLSAIQVHQWYMAMIDLRFLFSGLIISYFGFYLDFNISRELLLCLWHSFYFE